MQKRLVRKLALEMALFGIYTVLHNSFDKIFGSTQYHDDCNFAQKELYGEFAWY